MKVLKKVAIGGGLIVITIISFILVSYILRPTSGDNEEVRNRTTGFYAEPDDSLDAVVVGSSAVYRYINNLVLWKEEHITSYNFAFPGLSMYLIPGLIEEVSKSQTPKLYIIDARNYILEEDNKDIDMDRATQVVNNLNYSINRYSMINKITKDTAERFNYYFDIIINHSSWDKVDSTNYENALNSRKNEYKGWAYISTVEKIKKGKQVDDDELKNMPKDAEKELLRLIKIAKKENIKLLFVATPWQSSESYQKMSNYMKKIVESYGYDYFDSNDYVDKMDLDYNADFYNIRHTNAFGAEKFTKVFGHYLSKKYNFNTKHNSKVIKSWNKASKKNDKKMDSLVPIIKEDIN